MPPSTITETPAPGMRRPMAYNANNPQLVHPRANNENETLGTSEILTITGLILALLIGLPSLFVLFIKARRWVGTKRTRRRIAEDGPRLDIINPTNLDEPASPAAPNENTVVHIRNTYFNFYPRPHLGIAAPARAFAPLRRALRGGGMEQEPEAQNISELNNPLPPGRAETWPC